MTDHSILADSVNALRQARVLCVGDVMLDQFVYGDVDRISPEAPIPVLRVRRETAMLGGAGNVVRNLCSLGARTHFVSLVGDDMAGREVVTLVGSHPEVDPALVVETGRQTTIKTRFSAGSQQLLRADRETTVALAPESLSAVLDRALGLMDKVGAVVLSDYGKGVLGAEVVRKLIERANEADRPVVVDPKGSDYSVYAGATLVTPNRKELHEATGMPVDGDDAIVAAARHLIETCGIRNVLVTRSQDGMTLLTRDGEVHHLPAEAREVFDVSGAGDTVVAAMAAAIATGTPLTDAARLANVAAGIVVGKVGTAVVYVSDLLSALLSRDLVGDEVKIQAREAAADQVARWRHKGRKVGFTNGCFDLLHPGHISLLNQARAQCDCLVVGLNSDQSVKRLKGDSRPVQTEISRATVLASLTAVDLVVIFDEDTPRELIAALHPDVLVKGADYTIDKVVGADLVQGWGGRVVLAELAAGHSTTATIARMAG
ncbi:MAG: D-glycero-beta-D-manno-heptose-7-phosphate kinase [Telmatospirillum sp.]|nr:D-glycero-beta-D-manno-heptose-7-phosphate kinase [Telmatospirillum sp.]